MGPRTLQPMKSSAAGSLTPLERIVALRTPAGESSDARIVAGLRQGDARSSSELYGKYAGGVRIVLVGLLGKDGRGIDDLTQEVFLAAIAGIDRLRDPDALSRWLGTICDHVVRAERIRREERLPLEIRAPAEVPDVPCPSLDPVVHDAARVARELIDKLPAEERVPFCLRTFANMELMDIADACGVSLATVKRRIRSARKTFAAMASAYPELSDWLQGSDLDA